MMNIILGFGETHRREGFKLMRSLEALIHSRRTDLMTKPPKETLELLLNDFEQTVEPFRGKDKEHSRLHVGYAPIRGEVGDWVAIVPITVWHHRNDHPFSPDGFAAFGQPFTMSIVIQDFQEEQVRVVLAEQALGVPEDLHSGE